MAEENLTFESQFQRTIEEYEKKVRQMQGIVKQNVGEIQLQLTEAEGAPIEHCFDSNWSASKELPNWGYTGSTTRFLNTGHWWVTVKSASFRSKSATETKLLLLRLKKMHCKLLDIHQQLSEKATALEGEREIAARSITTNPDAFQRGKTIAEVLRQYEGRAFHIRKGLLSPHHSQHL